ncbi:hypothetical protein [Enterococcus sp. OL5]|uniref:hypothetical protein n=1 Tax=Enterococcus sp. OL5 TaxID=2590214 RepID=UPI0016719DF7|nr:hypothetical protein [Enterococcus sp. OL5]
MRNKEVYTHQPTNETLQAFKETKEIIEKSDLSNQEDVNDYFTRMKKEAFEEEHAEL